MQTTLSTSNDGSATSATTASDVPKSNGASISDMFTKLLVAQVKYQDPLSPSDPNQYVNQLAAMSQVDSLEKLTTLTTNNAAVLQNMQTWGYGSQVGSDVTVQTDRLHLGSSAVAASFSLGSYSSNVSVELTGTDGIKHSFDLGSHSAGDVSFSLDAGKLGLSEGAYAVKVVCANGENPSVGVTGKLTDVRVSSSGSSVLNVENVGQVLPSSITRFNGRSTTATN